MLALVQSHAASGDRVARRSAAPNGSASGVRRLAGWARLAAAVVLVAFHVVLLGSHLGTGRLFEPGVALRWSVGLVLLALLVGLRRVGVPVLWGRRALVVWVLVALLHVNTTPGVSDSFTNANPAAAALSLVVLPPSAGLVLAAGLLLLATMLARAWRLSPPASGRAHPVRAVRLRSHVHAARLASRGPPLPASC